MSAKLVQFSQIISTLEMAKNKDTPQNLKQEPGLPFKLLGLYA